METSVSNASQFLPRILSPTTQLGKTESSASLGPRLHWTSRESRKHVGRTGKALGLPERKMPRGSRQAQVLGGLRPPSSPGRLPESLSRPKPSPFLWELQLDLQTKHVRFFYDEWWGTASLWDFKKEKKRRRKKEGGEGLGNDNAIVFGHRDCNSQ